ncbi:DUF6325 family protein [Oerskovia merdavium]|uniref:DUF4180 domain-containing protein n=1 Tax=Oerskovia merdavium TaxID=2762227 RepID=A0ABR8TXJ6_9CELL|nr:DUF6325 family protein [Oerskovia merdavium]MBD7980480.1 hypothetical protein [Oerskovia merdavium]
MRDQNEASDEVWGPVSCLLLEVPPGANVGPGVVELLHLVDSRAVRLLDIEVVEHTRTGLRKVDDADWFWRLAPPVIELVGSSSDLLDDEDLRVVADRLALGSVGIVVVYESLVMRDVVDRFASHGVEAVHSFALLPGDLELALDQSEPVRSGT